MGLFFTVCLVVLITAYFAVNLCSLAYWLFGDASGCRSRYTKEEVKSDCANRIEYYTYLTFIYGWVIALTSIWDLALQIKPLRKVLDWLTSEDF